MVSNLKSLTSFTQSFRICKMNVTKNNYYFYTILKVSYKLMLQMAVSSTTLTWVPKIKCPFYVEVELSTHWT